MAWAQPEGFPSRGGPDFDGSSDRGDRSRSFGGRDFEGRGEGFRRFGGGDFGGGPPGEGRWGGSEGRWGGGGEGRWGGERRWGGGPGGEGSWGGPGGEGRWGGRGPGSPDNGPAQPSQTANAAPVMKPRERISIPLPEAYLPGDLDGDQQIGLYEWRNWRRGDMQSFLELDHNGDGFLTPSELVKGPRSLMISSTPGGTGAPAATVNSSAPTAATAPAGTQAVSTTTTDAAPNLGPAVSKFSLLDKNRNGLVDPDEWSRSRTLKPLFEGAKIDLSAPMSKDDFVKHYTKLSPDK